MEDRKTTQGELASVIGMKRQTISQYVNGISEPSYEVLVKIARFFDVSTDYLLGLSADPAPSPSAVDDLMLSVDSVEWIKDSSRQGKDLSILFANDCFQRLIESILDYSDAVEGEEIYTIAESFHIDSIVENYKIQGGKPAEIAKSGNFPPAVTNYLLANMQLWDLKPETKALRHATGSFSVIAESKAFYSSGFLKELLDDLRIKAEEKARKCMENYSTSDTKEV